MVLLISKVSGLPLHVLVVHAVVVLIPLAVLSFVGTGWRDALRRTYCLPVAMLAVAGAVAAFMATNSGESLEHSVRAAAAANGARANFGEHPEQGDLARNVAVLFALAAVGLWVIESRLHPFSLPTWTGRAVYVGGSLVGVLAIVTIVIAGHSGASLVWKDIGNFVSKSA